MNNVIEKLRELDKRYYREGNSPVSDEKYDAIKEKAKKLYPDHPYFNKVGYPAKNEKVGLPYVIGSLNKVKIDSIEDWLKKIDGPIFCTEKLDSISLYVEYIDGELSFAAKRGDGFYGEDITEKAKVFCPKIDYMGFLHLRAEAMLFGDGYKILGFKNRRNGVAGLLNRDIINHDLKYIVPVFYEIIDSERDFNNEEEKLQFLDELGLETANYFIFDPKKHKIDELIKMLSYYKEKYKDYYDIDGLVLSPLVYERENVSFPKNKVAFKVNDEGVECLVKDVIWSTSRTGRVIPVINIEPVDIQGVTVSKATGFNAEYIMNNKIGKGSVVKITRSGDVIPYVVEVIKESDDDFVIPSCPSCSSPLMIQGVDLICTNDKCDSMVYKRISYFLRALGSENIDLSTIRKLNIDSVNKIYEIDEDYILKTPGFGKKKAEIVLNEIQKTLKTTPDRLISAFQLPGIGSVMSKSIADNFELNENFDKFFGITKEELLDIDGIGEILVEKILASRIECYEIWKYLKSIGIKFIQETGNLNGLKFCLTGKADVNRKELIEKIKRNGGLVLNSVTKDLNFLVTNDVFSNSGKMKKANEYKINIIDYDELNQKIGE